MGAFCGKDDSTASNNKSKKSPASESSLSFYSALPDGTQEFTIHHVYDGDTLTVVENHQARVRLLGVDAPELKEKEKYAKESADFLKKLCKSGGKIWLEFDGEREDRYGRLLAYIYVPIEGKPGFICCNIAMLEHGLANFYAPGDTELSKRKLLLEAAKKARDAKKNIWSGMNLKKTVYKTRNGSAFHRSDCSHLGQARLTEITLADAYDQGLNPCRTCNPV